MKMNLRQRILFPLFALALGTTLSLCIAEASLRLFMHQKLYSFERGLFQESDKYFYSLAPRTEKRHSQVDYSYIIKTNFHGFRGKEPNFDAQHRVMVLGDSYGMGQGVGEGKNLCDLAKERLRSGRADLDIFNTSVSGYCTLNELYVAREFAPKYKPELGVVFFCWNDVGVTSSYRVENGYLVLRSSNAWSARLLEWLNNNSRIYCLVKKLHYLRTNPVYAPENHPGFPEKDIASTLGYFGQMKQVCEKSSTRLVVVVPPLYGICAGGSPSFLRSKKQLMEGLDSLGIGVEDWALKLPSSNAGRLIFRHDAHWNEEGHRWFSDHLVRLIESNSVGDLRGPRALD